MRLGSITYPRALFTSPVGRGRRVAPGEGLRSLVREEPLTRFAPQIDLSPRGEVKRMRGQTDSIKDHRALARQCRADQCTVGALGKCCRALETKPRQTCLISCISCSQQS